MYVVLVFNVANVSCLLFMVVVVVLLFYVHGKHLRSCRDGLFMVDRPFQEYTAFVKPELFGKPPDFP